MLSWFMMQYNDTNINFLCLAFHTHLVRHINVVGEYAGSLQVSPQQLYLIPETLHVVAAE